MQLDLVSKNLGQAAGQISRVVDQCSDHSLEPDTGFAMVGQSAMLVGAQVSAIQGILGNPFDARDLLTTISEMENLAGQLDRKDRRDQEAGKVNKVKDRLQEMREEISGTVSMPLRVNETVECAVCRAAQSIQLGAYAGDTSGNVCRKCGSRFNAHRRSDGSVFTRPASVGLATTVVAPSPKRIVSECPECNGRISIVIPADQSFGVRKAVCLTCAASIRVDVATRATTVDGQLNKADGVPVDRYGSGGTGARPIVRCATCGATMRAMIRAGDSHYAIDTVCGLLYEVSGEVWSRWRHDNDPGYHQGDAA